MALLNKHGNTHKICHTRLASNLNDIHHEMVEKRAKPAVQSHVVSDGSRLVVIICMGIEGAENRREAESVEVGTADQTSSDQRSR